MKVEYTWLHIKDGESGKKLVVNLKWLLAWRMITGLNISDRYVDREIELSNGNLKWVDKDFECVGIRASIVFKFNDIHYIVYNDKFNIKADLVLLDRDEIFENKHVIKIETDYDEKVQKLNKRLSLLGSDNAYKITNGTNIINIDQHSKINNYDDLVNNTLFMYEDDIRLNKDLYLCVDDCDFVNLGGIQFDDIDLYSNKEKYLQYLNGYMTEHDDNFFNIDGNISMEEAHQVALVGERYKIRAKRIRYCFIKLAEVPDYIDLSYLDSIDSFTITDEDGLMAFEVQKVIDFKDKFIIFKNMQALQFYVFRSKLTIRSSNIETYNILDKMMDRMTSSRKQNVKLEFTGKGNGNKQNEHK